LSAEGTTKPWQLRERASDSEKFFIDFSYARQVTGNLEKAYQTLELWIQTYPRGEEEPNPYDLLAGLSTHGTGRFEKAIEVSRKAIEARPDFYIGYHGLASSYFFLDRFANVEHTSSKLPNIKWRNRSFSCSDTTSLPCRETRSRWIVWWLWPRVSRAQNTGWLTRRLSLWLVPAA
jgi:hypothetical protein